MIVIPVDEEIRARDGMTVDAAGDLWVAVYGGGRIHRYSPEGVLRQVLAVPAEQCRVLCLCGAAFELALCHHGNRGLERRATSHRARCRTWLPIRYGYKTGRPATPYRPDPNWWATIAGG